MPDPFIPIWMRGTPLEAVYLEAWIATGDVLQAREAVRADSSYDAFFAGNRRPDGSVRYDEDTYLGIVEAFEDSLLSIGVNPDLFQNQFGSLIEGLVSPAEFTNRIENVYTRVIDAAPEVRQQMSEYYEIGFTDQAIIASFLDPDIGDAILEKRIAVSEVGAEASKRGFTATLDFANRLYEAGTDTSSEAAQFFGLAANVLPTLQALAARHSDPDDDFSLEEFAASEIFSDPEQRRRLRRNLAQERASFNAGGMNLLAQTDTGRLTGLYEA